MTLLIIFQISALIVANNNYNNNYLIFALQQQQQPHNYKATLYSLQGTTRQTDDNIDNHIKKFTLIADENIIRISPDNALHPGGIFYKAMTFNETVPGPVIAVHQGDTFQITLKNKGRLVHSLDLHGIEGPSHALSASVNPNESKTLKVNAQNAGIFVYHCDGDNLNGIWEHIASGMYGGIVVHPANDRRAKEFYVVFGEIYNNADKGLFVGTATISDNSTTDNSVSTKQKETTAPTDVEKIGSFDMNKFMANKPDLILSNGMAYKYMPFFGTVSKIILNQDAEVFNVKPGELTRWYIVNAGPRDYLSFNFASAMISPVNYGSNNNPGADQNTINGYSAKASSKIYEVSIPPGSAQAIEVTFPEEGVYVGNDHDIGRFLNGAGFVVVANNNSSSFNDYPKGTWVPP